MTPTQRALSVASALLLVAGCGGSSKGSSKDTAPTLAEAKAAAAAINLKAADLPTGFKGTPHEDDGSGDDSEKEFATCLGVSDSKAGEIVDVSSDDFTRGAQVEEQDVSSSVTVVSSKKKAKADLTAFQSDKAQACFKQVLTKLVTTQVGDTPGVTLSTPEVTTLHPEASGMDGTFGFRVTLKISAGPMVVPMEMVIQGALKGHTELDFEAMSIGTPMTQAERDALWSKLVVRAASVSV